MIPNTRSAFAVPGGAGSQSPADGGRSFGAGLASFAAVAAQFGVIVLLVQHWELESKTLGRLMQVGFVGFLLHHFLPMRARLPFFAALSLASPLLVSAPWVGLLTGVTPLANFLPRLLPGLGLIGIGLGLIGMCHLPLPFGPRVLLVAGAGAGLAFLRANTEWFPTFSEMWVVLGSMFVFRTMVYLYDLKHRSAPFSPSRAIAYFFMLPNVAFPLFPLVDYKTFCATYYNEDWRRIYQTGVLWMLRGAVHLLLYRLVYQFAPLDVAELRSATDVAGFVVATYLLYLKVSGQFHIIVGLLHLFGFNLPETHHLYLLASSFTDFWRRINIYWKDFIMKLFFYPVFFRLRRLGTMRAMVLATLISFFATWALHSWQWFWIRGSVLLTWQDISFWSILALLVLANAIFEAKVGRRRTLTPSRITLRQRLVVALQTVGTFVLISTLWTVWSCQSWEELQVLADTAAQPSWRDVAIVTLGLLALGACGMLWGRSSRDTAEGRQTSATRGPFHFWRVATAVGCGAAGMLALPSVISHSAPALNRVVAVLRTDQLNMRDLNQQRRGYYEELDVARFNARRWVQGVPAGWHQDRHLLDHERADFLMKENAPSVSIILSGAPLTTNPLGMRDRDYTKAKPANTFRLLIVGASHEMGMGVRDHETFENLVEDRLNLEQTNSAWARYEILNLSIGAAGFYQKLMLIEQVGFGLQPDAVMLSVFAADRQFVVEHLSRAMNAGFEPPPEHRGFLSDVYRRAGVRPGMPVLAIQRRLQPFSPELFGYVFQRLASECSQRGILPLVVYRPAPTDPLGLESAARVEMRQLAGAAGLEILDLSPAFDSVADPNTLYLAEWDKHTSARGHQLLAEQLYEQLAPRVSGAGRRPPPRATDSPPPPSQSSHRDQTNDL